MTGQIVFYALAVLLPLSALIARRPPLTTVVKATLAWVAIGVVGLLLIGQRDHLPRLSARLSDDGRATGAETRIRQAGDGQFWADVTINGVARRMLVDTGATTTALSVATARAAGLDIERDPFPVILDTANGRIAARRATARRVVVGAIVADDLGVVVAPAFGDTDVLGMNFLQRLKSWRADGGTLILSVEPA